MKKFAAYLLILTACAGLRAQEHDLGNVVDGILMEAVQKYDDGDFTSSASLLAKLRELSPDNDAVAYYSGLAEFNLGNIDSSLVHMSRAVALDSTNLWYKNGLATVYLTKGDARSATPLLEELISERPQSFANSYTLSILADANLSAGNDSLALDYYSRALDYDPDYAPAQMGKAEVFRMKGNMPAFFSGFKQIVDNPDVMPVVKTSYLKALTEHMDSRFYWLWGSRMEEMIDSCIRLHPEDAESRELKIQYCAIRRDTTEMLSQCFDMLDCKGAEVSNKTFALGIIGDTYHSQGLNRKAYKIYDLALKLDPRCVNVLNNYAYFLSCEGRKLRKAAAMSAITVEMEPDNPTYLDTYGWILFLQGKAAEAKPYFKHAMIYGGKNSAVVLAHYAEVLSRLGEKDLAEYYRHLSETK